MAHNFFSTFPQNPLHAISLGNVEGVSSLFKFGLNHDSTRDVEETIWTEGGFYVFPSDTGVSLQAVSDNVADNVQITIMGLDVDFLEQSVTITLNGTTPVNIPGTWTRVFQGRNIGGVNILGDIDIFLSGNPATIYAKIEATDSVQRTHMCVHTIPSDKVGLLFGMGASFNKSLSPTSADIRLRIREFGKVSIVEAEFGVTAVGTSALPFAFCVPPEIPSKADIMLTAIPTGADPEISGFLSLVFVDS